ncbi:MAG: hypothetical protein ACUVWR_08505 [Anaerolineae bacterium]
MITGEGIDVVIHSTHEAGYKIGGIGAVLDGLLSAKSYLKNVRRSILIGPFDSRDAVGMERLQSPRNALITHYSSLTSVTGADPVSTKLREIEQRYRVRIIYGRRRFGQAQHELILVDPSEADLGRVNDFKYRLWERFGLHSDRYESNYEYDYYIRAAEPQYLALEAVLGTDIQRPHKVMMAHEFMGVPLCLAGELHHPQSFCRVYYAHEVPPVRPVVEGHPGHDTMFYNVMHLAQKEHLPFPQIFGDQSSFFKHALLEMAGEFAAIFAVGDLVVEELRFLGARFATKTIDLVYNGILTPQMSLSDKLQSAEKLRHYARNLLSMQPDYVFTHVARLVQSKGLWRDLRVMEHLDSLLAAQGSSAVLFVLATALPSGRHSEDILRMEAEYGWPVVHHEGHPDLVGAEVPFYHSVNTFNEQAKATKIVFVNQFGWDREHCGLHMPEDMSFVDIRMGSDLEFGQSIYEPFGIAQVEPLPYGALCLVSSACGCVGFATRASSERSSNVIVADYISLPPHLTSHSWREALMIGKETRDLVERYRSREAAELAARLLPKSDKQREELIQRGYSLAQGMSWEVVVGEYLLPALVRALHAAG